MRDRKNLIEWQEKFVNGDFNDDNCRVQISAGWYDWFCKDSSLRNKTYKMGNIIKQIKDGGKVNRQSSYVFFKNNCPCVGPLYDDFRICSLETGDVLLNITIGDKRNEYRYTVYGRDGNNNCHWDEPLFATNSSRELVKWLNTAW